MIRVGLVAAWSEGKQADGLPNYSFLTVRVGLGVAGAGNSLLWAALAA